MKKFSLLLLFLFCLSSCDRILRVRNKVRSYLFSPIETIKGKSQKEAVDEGLEVEDELAADEEVTTVLKDDVIIKKTLRENILNLHQSYINLQDQSLILRMESLLQKNQQKFKIFDEDVKSSLVATLPLIQGGDDHAIDLLLVWTKNFEKTKDPFLETILGLAFDHAPKRVLQKLTTKKIFIDCSFISQIPTQIIVEERKNFLSKRLESLESINDNQLLTQNMWKNCHGELKNALVF